MNNTVPATPRILPEHLQSTKGRTVRTLGTITSISSDQATLTCMNNATVVLIMQRDSHFAVGKAYEVLGKVVNVEGMGELGIKVLSSTEWKTGNDGIGKVDLKAFANVVECTWKYPAVFGTDM